MYSNIPTVSKAIKDILFSNTTYLNSLKLGIANYTALAIKIKPEVDTIIGSDVNINTIVVSIKRFADALQHSLDLDSLAQEEEKENLSGARISLTGSILEIEFDKEMENIEKVLNLFDRQPDIRFNIFQSKNHMNLFIENISEIKKIFNRNDDSPTITPSKIKEGVSMITISLLPWEEKELRKTYQLLSTISNILFENQVSLHNAFFTPNEIVLIINERDAARVYELLRVKFYGK
jgi:hypothetical protein